MDDSSFIKNELIVQLKDGIKPRRLESAFKDYQLKQKNVISKATNMWLFTYDMTLILPEKMLQQVKDSDLTKEVEFNKKLTQRKRD